MSTAPRPKPWEVSGVAASAPSVTSTLPAAPTAESVPSQVSSAQPSIPTRPTSLLSSANPTAPYSYNSTGYGGMGMSSYGGYGGYGMGSGMGTGMGSGMGSYGSGYGGYGGYGSYSSPYSRYGGGGMYGGAYSGGFGMPGEQNGLRGGFENSTAATFQLIESIVGAVGGFAQMLESTYMATHSSFFAMISVAEQFGHLKTSLGSILGVFALMRWLRRLFSKVSGAPIADAAANSLTPADFAKFASNGGVANRPRPSFKPLLMFLTAVFGFPYLMGKLIRAMADRQQNMPGMLEPGPGGDIDPSKLEFCRAVYDFVPENPSVELEMRKGDLVAILSRADPQGNASQWWRARTRDGRTGYIPSTYVEVIPRRLEEVKMIKE